MTMNNAGRREIVPMQTVNRCGRKSTADEGNLYYTLRVMNGLTVAKLSQYLRVCPNTICQLEHGGNAKFRVIKAMSELFGVSMDDLVRNNVAAAATSKSIGLPPAAANKQKAMLLARVDIGDLGEELIAGLERERLARTGYENRVSTKPAKNRRNGYDVISAAMDGQPKYIEVKTTTSSDPDEPFFMSCAEYRKMESLLQAGAVYRLYRVYDLRVETMDYRYIVYTPQDVLALYEPLPETYRMVRKGGQAA